MRPIPAVDRALLESEEAGSLSEALGLPLPIAAILLSRGYKETAEAEKFLSPDATQICDPLLLSDMERAAARIVTAIEKHEKTVIYGDYDADGVTSCALLYLYLRSKGLEPLCRIPDRLTEGYGLNENAVRALAASGYRLMITVDNGSTAPGEVALASEHGMETVVTDHHDCHGEMPRCAAHVNPMKPGDPYPFKGLSGVGVVYKLICAVERMLCGGGFAEVGDAMLDLYGDLVAIGTVADVMPLTAENRYIVKKGLTVLSNTKRAGLRALIRLAGAPKNGLCTTSTVAYTVAPRINAAGRLGDAGAALRLLTAENEDEGIGCAQKLCELNAKRQAIENRILLEAEEQIGAEHLDRHPVIVPAGEGWHPGVIGIVASRLVEKYGKPVVIFSLSDGLCRGSARSPEGFDLMKLFALSQDLTVRFGGHECAAGLTIRRIDLDALRGRFDEVVAGAPDVGEKCVPVTMELKALEINMPLAQALASLEPCGNGNDTPLFVLCGAEVRQIIPMSGGKHTKYILQSDGICHEAVQFGTHTALVPAVRGETADAVFELQVNEFGGRRSVQLLLRGLYPSGETARRRVEEEERAGRILSGLEEISPDEYPRREDFARVYKAFAAAKEEGAVSLPVLLSSLLPMNAVTFFVALAVLAERRLIDYGMKEHLISFTLPEAAGKADLAASPVLRGVRVKNL